MLSTFEMSLDQGKPVLIENMGEGARARFTWAKKTHDL
jgi:hypothetical protein